jgi:glycosyltransferase involved in cell wall biosynthesis
MRHLDRSRFRPYGACATGPEAAPTPTFEAMRSIPGLEICAVDLGREGTGGPLRERIRNVVSATRAVSGLVKLAALIWRHDIAIVHTTDRPRDALCGVILSRLTPARSVVHLHVGHGDWMSRMRTWSIRHADVVVTVSNFVKQTLVSSGFDSGKIHPVLNGIEISRWNRSRDDDRIRRDLGLPGGAPVILTVCRLFPFKGPGELIGALSSLVGEWPDLRLVIVGGEMDPGYREALERQARELGVERNVVFTGWRPDVADIMASSDVFAMPSIGEPLGLVYLEAMAMGLPVVALDSGGAPEVVGHGTTGLLSSPGDGEMLAEHLRMLLRSAELRGSMGSQGRKRVETYFTADRMTRDIELLYEGITSCATQAAK